MNNKRVITNTNEGLAFFNKTINEFLLDIEENSLKDEYLLKIKINEEEYVLDMCANISNGVINGLEPLGYHNIYCEDCLKNDFNNIISKSSVKQITENRGLKKIIKLFNDLSNEKEISLEIKNTIISIPKEHKHFIGCFKDCLLDELHDYVTI